MLQTAFKPALLSVLLAVAALWTSSNEAISTAPIEAELAAAAEDCQSQDRCPAMAANILTHWISRTNSGNLYLVLQTNCQSSELCLAWFVERTARGTATRLNIEGQFRVLNSNKAIPDVQTWRAVSDNETEYTRYTWMGGAFIKAETRTAYRVDGVECGSALECYQIAHKAHAEHDTGRALKIWEKVHNVSWI